MMSFDHIRVRYFLYCLLHRNGYDHGSFLKKRNAFQDMGDKCYFQPYNLPADAKLIRLGNNVVVASNVTFVCHDGIHYVLNGKFGGGGESIYHTYWDVIDIKDNVFIGANSTILSGVTIGANSIVAAGAVVNSDVPEGTVVGGVPAKVIGNFNSLNEKRLEYSQMEYTGLKKPEMIKELWKMHDEKIGK